jgi:DNA end-binding protein Ku
MPKAVWKGSLNLGLVIIPVSLYAATEPKDVRFHLVDRAGRRVRYRRFVETESDSADPPIPSRAAGSVGPETPIPGEAISSLDPADPKDRREPGQIEVAYEDLVRGFEVDRDRLVTLEPEEIERARPQPSHTIDLEHFVRLDDIDPIYFEKSYFLAPRYGTHAGKPYALLLRAMRDVGRVGSGRFVLRTKPHLVAVRAAGDVLALETLYFGDEVRDPKEIVSWLQGIQVEPREIEMAEQLISMLETEWDPSAYADDYREELLRIIAEKTPSEIVDQPDEVRSSAVEDLMQTLKASVEAARTRPKPKRSPRSEVG